jgi:hypothetical protein
MLPDWKVSPVKGEAQLLDLCCNWLATQKLTRPKAVQALSALAIELYPSVQLYQALMYRSIPTKFLPNSIEGKLTHSFGRQEVEDMISQVKISGANARRMKNLDPVEIFGLEMHGLFCHRPNVSS